MRQALKQRGEKDGQLRVLHPIDALGIAPAREGEIRVERIEKRLQPRVPFPHKHDFYHFLFLTAGSGWHEIDFEKIRVEKGQLFLMRPGQVHSWSLGAGTKGLVLEFTRSSLPGGERSERLLAGLELLPAVCPPERAATLLPLLKLMHEEFSGARPGFRAVLESLLQALLIRLEREAPIAAEAPARGSAVEKFRELVEKYYQKEHAVEFYAARLGMSTKALTTRVSRALGKPAGAVVQERCLVEAKRLLAYSRLPVSEIGYMLGYDDPNYFARFFRQRTGISPGRFRALSARSVPV